MQEKQMPHELRMKVRRYLDYVFESKKEVKIDEKIVFQMLSEGLKDKIRIQLRGRILNQIPFLLSFGLDFLSEIT